MLNTYYIVLIAWVVNAFFSSWGKCSSRFLSNDRRLSISYSNWKTRLLTNSYIISHILFFNNLHR